MGLINLLFFHLSAYQLKKNVERIIVAYAIAKKRYKVREKLVIGGKRLEHLKELARKLGVENDVVFVGFIPEEDLPLFYGAAKAFMFPSLHESFGTPIIEAMACGLSSNHIQRFCNARDSGRRGCSCKSLRHRGNCQSNS